LSGQYENGFYYSQANQGPSIARHHGIRRAKGGAILPLGSDDIISSDYISEAIKAFRSDPEVKVGDGEAEKLGETEGKWRWKRFSLKRLALDKMMFVGALYKKKDWEACGGYSEDMVWGREDWEFWITMLKNGGKVVKLPITGFYYRIRTNSRRKGMTKERKEKIIEYINRKHREFIYGQLNGPLRFQRTHSRKYNTLLKMLGLLK